MRLRKIKDAKERLEKDENYFISNPREYKGKWKSIFKNDNPIWIEVGAGKGNFAIGMAKHYDNVNFIAIEKFDSVLIKAIEKAQCENISNLKFINDDAILLEEIFDNAEVSNIFLNFSDPWPKTRHAKRRLTSPLFLKVYENILDENGAINQKTDNKILFEYTLESLSQNDWYLSNISVDLHAEEGIFNVETEYEAKKKLLGPIYRLEARKYKNKDNKCEE
ncbi:MAG: tRNA (guanosine(46)-N7)-methyltransferase TrmB [Anaeroplasmataceae bacterium]